LVAREVTPERFAGLYRVLEDGWRGRLLLTHDSGRRLTGQFRTDRYANDFVVRAEVDVDVPHKVHITIEDFNEMDEQLFLGYLFRDRANVIAGTTYAEQTTFGFCARKTRSLMFAAFGSGDVRPEHFAGLYILHEDDRKGLLSLDVADERNLTGTYTQLGAPHAYRVTGRVDDVVRHAVRLQIDHPQGSDDRIYTGYLATRPKNLVAGSVDCSGLTLGFYMVKLSERPSSASTASTPR
jgi:hypothetical protein